jgi:hypothetical protein
LAFVVGGTRPEPLGPGPNPAADFAPEPSSAGLFVALDLAMLAALSFGRKIGRR